MRFLGGVPIRVKLTAAFATAMLAMVACAAAFVFLRLRADLDDAIDAHLRARADVLLSGGPDVGLDGVALEDPEESFVQILTADGRIWDGAGSASTPSLSRAEIARVTTGDTGTGLWLERRVPGIDGPARMLALHRPAGGNPLVLVVGQSLVDRDDALSSVITSFTVGGAAATLLASGIGYLLARAGLAPVEAMRRRALDMSFSRAHDGLPLPSAKDEIRRLGETLNDMLERLRSAFEREGRFVADASHELRTPLAVIKTELEGALLSGQYGPPVREGLLAAVQECDRLGRLAEDLLVLARSAGGGLPLRPVAVHAQLLIEDVRDRFADHAHRAGRQVRTQPGRGHDEFCADPDRVRQALTNLVDNALRHGAGDVTVGFRRGQDGVEFQVSDCGPGIQPDVAAHAFERFSRGDPARNGEGAGLGLAIVHAVAQAHQGRASISPQPPPGSGTVARLWLPSAPPHTLLS